MAEKFKVFISWSGELAKAVATVWTELITEVFDGVAPFMSEENIGAGERGLAKIATELAGTGFGIIVVTQDNQHSQWLNYEAGALSKDVDDQTVRVAPSLVDFDRKNDVTGPLGQFQGTLLNEGGVEKILTELAKVIGVDETSVRKRFHRAWADEYEDKFERAKATRPRPTKPAHRQTPEMLDEILTLVREIARTSKPPVELTKAPRPDLHRIREAINFILADDFDQWRVEVGPRNAIRQNVTVTLPFELPDDIEEKLANDLMDIPGVHGVAVKTDPHRFGKRQDGSPQN
ncbi:MULTISPECIES: TIR domain-containing protein [Mycolicibacterium]|uniref:TIR domain-containing protein n=1 Tax=Mycolicibacterium senegalense TaxID=1796 RepID=A0A378T3K7_9MYCO|nr:MULTISPECIES: TIR domain-containing protein [Mycolicibacterium]MCV7338621.1 TIR domain-containing protein [Mycolicibacterium senegalense]MDR7289675.1 hypothetical protein [Mycolicibacterium senegalense]QZA26490.1 TIR domain-containing protein [Mycolicibacterium senegalense]CDP82945.1 hypothetical protein BN975_00745 [Mycolicibacterium farcinogenes]STZ54964.1 Uncharacterised protein [Mycolicibacterium senegalense]